MGRKEAMAELHRAVFRALSAAMGMEDAEAGNAFRIRQAMVNPSPPPPPADQDVLYYHILPENFSPRTEWGLTRDGYPSLFHFAALRLNLTFYGQRAAELAWAMRDRIYADGAGNPRQILRRSGIYPIPDPPPPSLIREEWEKEHRLRADLTIRLRAAISLTEEDMREGIIETAPDIEIHTL